MGESKFKNVLIVGCGYVGLAVGRALAQHGATVRGSTTSSRRFDEIAACGIEPVMLDVADGDAVGDAARGHEAIYLCVGAGRGRAYGDVYLPAARGVVAALKSTDVRRVIYTSSTGVYAQDEGQWVDEESAANPISDNSKILVETERILLEHSTGAGARGGAKVSVVRLGGIYGPGRELADFVRRSAGTSRSDGRGYVNMVHLDDIAAALVSLLSVQHHGVLNLCDDEPVTRRVFYDTIAAKHDMSAIRWTPSENGSLGKRVCNRRIKDLLKLELKHPAHC
jgi:nucleoside-diphosphate-sugar epimerase